MGPNLVTNVLGKEAERVRMGRAEAVARGPGAAVGGPLPDRDSGLQVPMP